MSNYSAIGLKDLSQRDLFDLEFLIRSFKEDRILQNEIWWYDYQVTDRVNHYFCSYMNFESELLRQSFISQLPQNIRYININDSNQYLSFISSVENEEVLHPGGFHDTKYRRLNTVPKQLE